MRARKGEAGARWVWDGGAAAALTHPELSWRSSLKGAGISVYQRGHRVALSAQDISDLIPSPSFPSSTPGRARCASSILNA